VTSARESRLLRRSAAVLNGDIAGFSRLVADDVAATVEDIDRARTLTREAVATASGTLVDFIGDSFMAVFPTASAAVDAARRIRVDVDRMNAGLPSRRHVTFRMGIAVGELVSDGEALFGDAVNIAARVRDTVEPGEIAMTGEAFVRLDAPELPVEPLGRRLLKNIPEPVHVYRLRGVSTRVQDVLRADKLGRARPCIAFHGVVPLLEDDATLVRMSQILTREFPAGLMSMPALTLVGGSTDALAESDSTVSLTHPRGMVRP